MATEKDFLGVTPPISTSESTEREKEVTRTLMDELRRQNIFESEGDAQRRESALGRVTALVKNWVRIVSLSQGMSEVEANAAGGKIFTFGSYRLGVHGPGADIDALCVVPKHVSRSDFFAVLEPMLREVDGVTELWAVPNDFVPILKAKIYGIPLDLVMAQLALPSIPDDLSLHDDSHLLLSADKKYVRSLGGPRITDEILRLVPNIPVFQDSLRCIKLWAQQRAIYSNVYGFFGGVSLAILVARICQLYPNAIAATIVSRLFLIMGQWSWPQPVLLKHVEEGPGEARVWNPKRYHADRSHRMPIITPTYPSMCTTHSVTSSTQMIITEEFKKGADIMNKVIAGSASWSDLFAKHDFFHKYQYYLQIIASTTNIDLKTKWTGTVKSKIRQLVKKLEKVDSVQLAHPFVKGFDQVTFCISEDEVRAVAQGEISDAVSKRKEEDIAGKEGASSMYLTVFYIGLASTSTPGANLDITNHAVEFTKLAKTWNKFNEAFMDVIIQHIQSSALPDYVFDAGEWRPEPAQEKEQPIQVNKPGKSDISEHIK